MKYQYFIVILFCLFCFPFFSYGQQYATAVGLRIGSNDVSRTFGIQAHQRVISNITLAGIMQTDFDRNSTMHFLLQKHRPIIAKRFNYFYGAGVSFGREESFVKEPETKTILHTYGNKTNGIDLIGGLELTIGNTVFGVDYKPNFNISGREEFARGQVGVSIKSVLVTSKEQDKRWRQKAKAKKKAKREAEGKTLKARWDNTFKRQ